MPEMRVQKRNGDYEEVSFDKILTRIKLLCNSDEFTEKLNIVWKFLENDSIFREMSNAKNPFGDGLASLRIMKQCLKEIL